MLFSGRFSVKMRPGQYAVCTANIRGLPLEGLLSLCLLLGGETWSPAFGTASRPRLVDHIRHWDF